VQRQSPATRAADPLVSLSGDIAVPAVQLGQRVDVAPVTHVVRDRRGHLVPAETRIDVPIAIDERPRDQTAQHAHGAPRLPQPPRYLRGHLRRPDIGVDEEELLQLGGVLPCQAPPHRIEVLSPGRPVRNLDQKLRPVSPDHLANTGDTLHFHPI
jgi:hypothetical protein